MGVERLDGGKMDRTHNMVGWAADIHLVVRVWDICWLEFPFPPREESPCRLREEVEHFSDFLYFCISTCLDFYMYF